MLRSELVRPRGASRRLRATEHPTLFTKTETQAHTFQNATRGRVTALWASAINSTTIRSQRSSRQRAGTQDIGFVRFLTKRQDFRDPIDREPSKARAAGPDLAPSCHRALICRTRSHAPDPGTTSVRPQACTNFATSTSTRLDSHVASHCRFGKAGRHGLYKHRRGPMPRRGASHDAATHVRIFKPKLAASSALGQCSQHRAPPTRSFSRCAAL